MLNIVNICEIKGDISYIRQMILSVGPFFTENLVNSAPLVSMTYTCVGYTALHAAYIHTKCWQAVGW